MNKENKLIFLYYMFLILSTILVIGVLVFDFIIKQDQEKLIELNDQKLQLQMEMEMEENEEEIFKKKYKEVLKYTPDITRIMEEVEYIPEEYREKVLALCWTESHLKYGVTHPWKDSTTGICGIKSSFWAKYLKEYNTEVNSLYGGYLVLKYLEDKNNGNFEKAVRAYKGAKKNFESSNKVLNIYKKLKEK